MISTFTLAIFLSSPLPLPLPRFTPSEYCRRYPQDYMCQVKK